MTANRILGVATIVLGVVLMVSSAIIGRHLVSAIGAGHIAIGFLRATRDERKADR